MAATIFHPLLALIASATSNELVNYIEFLKEENQILRAQVPGQNHTMPSERSGLIKLGKALNRAIEDLFALVSFTTFYRWVLAERADGKLEGVSRRHLGRSNRQLTAHSKSPPSCNCHYPMPSGGVHPPAVGRVAAKGVTTWDDSVSSP